MEDLIVNLAGGTLRLSSGQIVREYLDQDTQCEKSRHLFGGAATPTSGRSQFVVAVPASGPAPMAGLREGEFIAAVKEFLSSGVKTGRVQDNGVGIS
jgi:predicted metalloprotease with PDZ domain